MKYKPKQKQEKTISVRLTTELWKLLPENKSHLIRFLLENYISDKIDPEDGLITNLDKLVKN